MLLSVLSALARLDLDPWREAAELARMPKEAAKQRLRSLIEALPDCPPTRPEPGTISTRLIALLPPGARSSIASSEAFHGAGVALTRVFVYIVLVNALFMVAMMGAQWAAVSLRPPAKADSAQTSSTGAVLPPLTGPSPWRGESPKRNVHQRSAP
jgi:hypothetical protein